MREVVAQNIRGILLNDCFREGGSFTNESGKLISYSDGYKITILTLGGKSARDLRGLIVDEKIANSVQEQLSTVPWGSVVQLTMRGNTVEDVQVLAENSIDFDM